MITYWVSQVGECFKAQSFYTWVWFCSMLSMTDTKCCRINVCQGPILWSHSESYCFGSHCSQLVEDYLMRVILFIGKTNKWTNCMSVWIFETLTSIIRTTHFFPPDRFPYGFDNGYIPETSVEAFVYVYRWYYSCNYWSFIVLNSFYSLANFHSISSLPEPQEVPGSFFHEELDLHVCFQI